MENLTKKYRLFKACRDFSFIQVSNYRDTYLNDLAVLLTNLRMALDMDMIIGGEVGRFMEPHLEELTNKMTEYDLFQRDIDYVLACRPRNAFTAGAANLALDAFIGTLL